MKFTLTFSYVARRDFNNIYSYIYLLNPHSAKTIIGNIVKQVELLRNFPELGKRVTQKSFFDYFDLRYLVIDKYVVYYTVNKLTRTVEVHGVMKQSMDWQKILTYKTNELLSNRFPKNV